MCGVVWGFTMIIPRSPELELELRLLYPRYTWDVFLEKLLFLAPVSVNLPIYEKDCIEINGSQYMAVAGRGLHRKFNKFLMSTVETYELIDGHYSAIRDGKTTIINSYRLVITVNP